LVGVACFSRPEVENIKADTSWLIVDGK